MEHVRRAAVAGTWYPGTADRLARELAAHLSAVSVPSRTCPRAIVAPHAGLRYSGPVAAYAYAAVAECRYAAAVLVGPSHFLAFDGVSIWPDGAFETPFGSVMVERDLAAALQASSLEIIPRRDAHGREHSLEMQLPFVAHLLPGIPIVPLVMGYQTRGTAEKLGDAVADAVTAWRGRGGAEVLLVASTDLSHYQPSAIAVQMDDVILRHVDALNPDGLMDALEREPKHACGGGPLVSVLRAARHLGATEATVLRYADSGDVSGDKSSVVGYMAAAVW